MTRIRRFDPEQDLIWLHALWQRSLSARWSMSLVDLKRRIGKATLSMVAERNGDLIGFCAADHGAARESAAVLAILVHPAHRHMGGATALLEELQATLAEQGVTSLALGYGGTDEYFWPGVPTSQGDSWGFFAKHGWRAQEHNFDLIVDLARYCIPNWVVERFQDSGAALEFATAETEDRVVRFEREDFPEWVGFYEEAFSQHKHNNVLCARAGGTIVGAVLLNSDEPVVWNQALGPRCGSFGVLGVAPDWERRGIGLALAARALEILRLRGCQTGYIGWTGLVNWYAQLGATIWSEYQMGRKQLAQRSQSTALR